MLGDVVGNPGLEALEALLPGLIREYAADFVTVNGENVADGFGLTRETLERILAAGADVVTSGNHVWEKRDFWPVMDAETRILRPANYPKGTAGRGWVRLEKTNGPSGPPVSWIVINLQGRELMPATDCPFKKFDSLLDEEIPAAPVEHALYSPEGQAGEQYDGTVPIILVDFHAETSREKEALGFYLDGRTGLVAGTHTHVQTADERILPQGTGYITDLGMTGVANSIIGMDTKICLDRARTQILYRMECAKVSEHQKAEVQGIVAEIDRATGKAVSIKRLRRGQATL
ncbi:MAG: YmdB family metallophosphoesterase [Spirochaetaceae bacterium]|jgi:calcineurin-like phosphoesterase|nr:YmdB family metallophosphoesterase [Spirochaetaceae bacterium]